MYIKYRDDVINNTKKLKQSHFTFCFLFCSLFMAVNSSIHSFIHLS